MVLREGVDHYFPLADVSEPETHSLGVRLVPAFSLPALEASLALFAAVPLATFPRVAVAAEPSSPAARRKFGLEQGLELQGLELQAIQAEVEAAQVLAEEKVLLE